MEAQSIAILEEVLRLPPSRRAVRLGHRDTLDAITSLGTDSGLAWLEQHIQSPVGPEWGRLIYSLQPRWQHLDRWMRLSKQHCLAAVDALLLFARSESGGEMPPGCDAASLHEALNWAGRQYATPRMEQSASEILHAWPIGARERRPVDVHPSTESLAQLLFRHDPGLLHQWHDAMATALVTPTGVAEALESLLKFADKNGVIAIVDHSELPPEILVRLANLQGAPGARALSVLANSVEAPIDDRSGNEAYFRALNRINDGSGVVLASLDHGCDDYPLTFLPADAVGTAEQLIRSLKLPHVCLKVF